MDTRLAQPDAPVGVRRNPCRLTNSACGGECVLRRTRLCPLQLVCALSPLRGFTAVFVLSLHDLTRGVFCVVSVAALDGADGPR